MLDAVLIAVVVGFFAVAALFVRWCDGVVGGRTLSVPAPEESDAASTSQEVAA